MKRKIIEILNEYETCQDDGFNVIETDFGRKYKLAEDLDKLFAKLEYWEKRCKLAEKYIEESPCDPDIYEEQLIAYNNWIEFKKSD